MRNIVRLSLSAAFALASAIVPAFAADNGGNVLTTQDIMCAHAYNFCVAQCDIINAGYDALAENCRFNCGFDLGRCNGSWPSLTVAPQSLRPAEMGALTLAQ